LKALTEGIRGEGESSKEKAADMRNGAICAAEATKAKGKDGSYFNSKGGQHDSREMRGYVPLTSACRTTGALAPAAPSSDCHKAADEARLPCESVEFKVYYRPLITCFHRTAARGVSSQKHGVF
jgi:hypothetical protein